jgi:hypothetical protein
MPVSPVVAATWGTPVDVGTGNGTFGVRLAGGTSGVLVAVWSQTFGGVVARAQINGQWGDPITLDPQGLSPDAIVDSSGNVTVVWSQYSGPHAPGFRRLVSRRFDAASQTWSPLTVLSAEAQFASEPRMAVDTSGTVAVAWARLVRGLRDAAIEVVRVTAAGASTVDTAAAGEYSNVVGVGVAPGGDVSVLWATARCDWTAAVISRYGKGSL